MSFISMTNSTSSPRALHAFFGGTFDPIHYGHLKPLESLAIEIGIKRVILLPNFVPPHRIPPQASALQRLNMVELAITENPLFTVDDRELYYTIPSYTINTLKALRAEPDTLMSPIAFIIGQDSLLTLYKWHDWDSFLDLCHLLVLARPGYYPHFKRPDLQQWLESHRITNAMLLRQKLHGYIYLAHTPELNISSTEIRKRHHNRLKYDHLLPCAVHRYIELHGLYY